MDQFFESLICRAATLDELLGEQFETDLSSLDPTLGARRLGAWCQSSAAGDWAEFGRRLARDGLAVEPVRARLSSGRRSSSATAPPWLGDAIWIDAALESATVLSQSAGQEHPFGHLFEPLVAQAEAELFSDPDSKNAVGESGRASLRRMLFEDLCGLCAPALYEEFNKLRTGSTDLEIGSSEIYKRFIRDLAQHGARELFASKPVLLRLIALLTRQWIDTNRLFLQRLWTDLPSIRRELLSDSGGRSLLSVEGSRSDRHNGGFSVLLVRFTDGAQVVYKPKHLDVDVRWNGLISFLNKAGAPVELRSPKVLAGDGYGWAEYIHHSECADKQGFRRYFQRAGAWLALLHQFVGADMHQENIIAAGEHPIPIDLETLFHANIHEKPSAEWTAKDVARKVLNDSVMSVGLLPAYGRSPFNRVFAMGGMTSGWDTRTKLQWLDLNTDSMRPSQIREAGLRNSNLPYNSDQTGSFKDYSDVFVQAFADYYGFLNARSGEIINRLKDFARVHVRRVVRPTRFYFMLQQRLRNHKTMYDGVVWSAQADFLSRLALPGTDPLWQLQRLERESLLNLDIPHFTSKSDDVAVFSGGCKIGEVGNTSLSRAEQRIKSTDAREIGWQVEVLKANLGISKLTNNTCADLIAGTALDGATSKASLIWRASQIANDIGKLAIRRDQDAAWIGFQWFEDAEAFQLSCMGDDLYNGNAGIALFLGAHASVSGSDASRELAISALGEFRRALRSPGAARLVRRMGIGGASGFSSVLYSLTVLGTILNDRTLQVDAVRAAELITEERISADKHLDLMSGSAGAILCLLRLYRDTGAEVALKRAIACGEHLLRQERRGVYGKRSWPVFGNSARPLTGMSHGAAGFAYALLSLYRVTRTKLFLDAGEECLAFEESAYDVQQNNWPDFRDARKISWPVQWCHGAVGIGLSRAAILKGAAPSPGQSSQDLLQAVSCTQNRWPFAVDTYCCGALGAIELMREASDVLDRPDLSTLAATWLSQLISKGSSRNNGGRRFDLGLFRGVAGMGYACLRGAEPELPNVLLWQ